MMLQQSPIVECNNCGTKKMWTNEERKGLLVKVLPLGWSMLRHTYSGDVYFCSAKCQEVWCSTREWRAPMPAEIVEAKALAEAPKRHNQWPRTCECGMGPYNKRGYSVHLRHHFHVDRMALKAQDIQIAEMVPS